MVLKKIITIIAVSLCFSLPVCFATTTPNNNTIASAESIETLNAWARPSTSTIVGKRNNSAIYLEIVNNSDTDYNLVNVSSDVANKVELHKSFVDEKGVSKMVQLDKLVIPTKTSAVLQPGGMHIMLLDLKTILTVGDKFDLFLYFDNNTQKVVQVEVKTQ
ncbi:copper chaperone PCu(A)C [Candidatus Tisiphia endosymbiont of Hybos culiciformis]|uniref:copper chaperone PCu(A)C n=1 Tax=Candidatus Tisiphia endosymbiont of Hybos culiciformis TaxID=3139331 RepID=UPI003CCABAB6